MNKQIVVSCPTCGKEFNYKSSVFRPFCNERCKLIDLGQWLEGNYKLPAEEPISESDLEKILEASENGGTKGDDEDEESDDEEEDAEDQLEDDEEEIIVWEDELTDEEEEEPDPFAAESDIMTNNGIKKGKLS